jgi:hypothetical protein
MKIEPKPARSFNVQQVTPVRAEDLFMPDVEAVVRHLARMAAERDYNAFIAQTKSGYPRCESEEESP